MAAPYRSFSSTEPEVDPDLASFLRSDEELLWSGAPPRGLMFRRRDLTLVPFSIVWAGFAFFWEASAIVMGAPLFFPVFGAPFVLVGLYLVVGRFAVDAWVRSRTRYAVTSRRILVVTRSVGQSRPKLRALDLEFTGGMSVAQNHDGSGTIRFQAGRGSPELERVSNVQDVHATIQRAREALGSG